MLGRAASRIEDRLVPGHADVEAARGRELIIDSPHGRVAVLREYLVDVEERIRTRESVGLRFAIEPVRAEEVNPILLDGAAEGRARLLIRVRQHGVREEVFRVELVIAEVAAE